MQRPAVGVSHQRIKHQQQQARQVADRPGFTRDERIGCRYTPGGESSGARSNRCHGMFQAGEPLDAIRW
jgi:hypothetical protein